MKDDDGDSRSSMAGEKRGGYSRPAGRYSSPDDCRLIAWLSGVLESKCKQA